MSCVWTSAWKSTINEYKLIRNHLEVGIVQQGDQLARLGTRIQQPVDFVLYLCQMVHCILVEFCWSNVLIPDFVIQLKTGD